ncbi:MAG: TerB family tellurite resistance protein [Parvularculaceae bacterium]
MLERLKNLFSAKAHSPAQSADDDAFAVAGLLVEAARSDDHYTMVEKKLIDRALVRGFAVAPESAGTIRVKAEAAQAEAADIYKFTRKAKSFTPERKIALIESLWRVILSDGERNDWEDALVRRVCGLIYVSDMDSGLARQRIEKELTP